MAEIGGRPILWHIMKNFSARGDKDFYIYQSDITVDLQNNAIKIHKNITEDWNVFAG